MPFGREGSFMKRLFAALMVFVPLSAHAGDVTKPVKDIITLAAGIATDNTKDGTYFDDEHLARDFSKAFTAAYRIGEKYPVYDSPNGLGSPFDYDVIANGQDSCPFKDIRYSVDPAAKGVTSVHVQIDNKYCMTDDLKDTKTKLIFKVVTEKGKPVIDDLIIQDEDAVEPTLALKAYLKSYE